MSTEETPLKAIQVKLVLLGEAAVGKSSLVLRFVQNDFNENTSPTIGAAFLTQKCRLENRVVKFEIWDTAGQERFHSLAPMYYRNAQAAVVVYDITKAASLEKAKSWVKELQRQASANIVIALVGNKLDLVDIDVAAEGNDNEEEVEAPVDPRQISTEEAESYARESHLLFFEASARTGQNVGDLFTEIAKAIPVDSIAPKPIPAKASSGAQQQGVNLGDTTSTKKGGCC